MKQSDKQVAGLDINGIWDHSVHIDVEGGDQATERYEDLGPRSVVVRARRSDGESTLIGGREAIESVYGRGEAAFGEVGRIARRKEVGEAWARIRGEYETEYPGRLKQDAEDEEGEITPRDALLAQTRAAIGRVGGGHAKVRTAGVVMRDDEKSTEDIQAEVRQALDWNALGGTRSFLVWDSVAVAKATLNHCPDLHAGGQIAVVTCYGKRIRIYRLGIRDEEGRRVPERYRADDPSGRSETETAGPIVWHQGWDASLGDLRAHEDRENRAVIRQTRQAEEWAQGEDGKAVVRVREGSARWTTVSRPVLPAMRPNDKRIAMEDEWSKVVVWTPMGRNTTRVLAGCFDVPRERLVVADARWAAEGAALAALDREQDMVPWYDHLDRMVIKVERDGDPEELVLVDENESVPAGRAYRTSDRRARQISNNIYMTEDNDVVSLPLTKGQDHRRWSQTVEVPLARRPKGRANVELRARQTPGQGLAEIELWSDNYEPWRDAPLIVPFSRKAPDRDAVKPALIRYEPSSDAWESGGETSSLLEAAKSIQRGVAPSKRQLDAIRNWLRKPLGEPPLNKEHAIGTEGLLPTNVKDEGRRALEIILAWTEKDLLDGIRKGTSQRAKVTKVNALHLIHTWCFARASPEVLEVLIQATEGLGKVRAGLQWEKDGAHRAIWQGLGRSVTTRDTIERVLDGALLTAMREEVKTMKCDALAAVSHLLARRHLAGVLVLEDGRRARDAATVACEKMRRMSSEIQRRPDDTFTMQPGIQLRYAVLLAGGLARVKDMHADCLQRGTPAATDLARALRDAICSIDEQQGWNARGARGLKPIMERLRGVFNGDEQPDTNLLKRLDA